MLLQALSRQVGETVSRQRLIDEIWGGDPKCDCALTAAVCSLRRYLRDDCLHPRYVETVRGQGYRLIAPVSAENRRIEQCPAAGPGASGKYIGTGRQAPGPWPFLADLVRRKVTRVMALYLLVSWFVLQVGELTFDALGVPAWCLTLLVLLVGLGFPIAAVLAWAFQITPTGVVLDVVNAPQPGNPVPVLSRRVHLLIIACLTCALVAMGFRLIELERRIARVDPASQVVKAASVNTEGLNAESDGTFSVHSPQISNGKLRDPVASKNNEFAQNAM